MRSLNYIILLVLILIMNGCDAPVAPPVSPSQFPSRVNNVDSNHVNAKQSLEVLLILTHRGNVEITFQNSGNRNIVIDRRGLNPLRMFRFRFKDGRWVGRLPPHPGPLDVGDLIMLPPGGKYTIVEDVYHYLLQDQRSEDLCEIRVKYSPGLFREFYPDEMVGDDYFLDTVESSSLQLKSGDC